MRTWRVGRTGHTGRTRGTGQHRRGCGDDRHNAADARRVVLAHRSPFPRGRSEGSVPRMHARGAGSHGAGRVVGVVRGTAAGAVEVAVARLPRVVDDAVAPGERGRPGVAHPPHLVRRACRFTKADGGQAGVVCVGARTHRIVFRPGLLVSPHARTSHSGLSAGTAQHWPMRARLVRARGGCSAPHKIKKQPVFWGVYVFAAFGGLLTPAPWVTSVAGISWSRDALLKRSMWVAGWANCGDAGQGGGSASVARPRSAHVVSGTVYTRAAEERRRGQGARASALDPT